AGFFEQALTLGAGRLGGWRSGNGDRDGRGRHRGRRGRWRRRLALSIAACLLLAVLAAVVAGAVLLLGAPASPALGGLLTGGGAVAGLGPRGVKALLTALE